ncbi:cell division protein ZapA [Cupriavidus oxalaticus]|jgi:hypothetical protein|uniref:Cell division protein ZapA n=1 Tax=Cupriavidus oxalaticus TaxID=96344 RepID=A0A5P3VVP1_9BURK|nr:cell division protein ZapA [Cupriavidus oxalaticus]QEZ48799.1 cell division protein ZapA [Cupriavidus oxalaticus]
MDLIVSICLNASAFHGSGGPAEAARQLRRLAGEIEANVPDFSACSEGQRIAGPHDNCACIAYLADL